MTAIPPEANCLLLPDASARPPLLGEVLDARTGEPLAGARVAATGAHELLSRGGGRSQASFCAAGEDGTFAVHLDRRGTLVLAVHARGYLPAIVPVSARTERVRVALDRAARIHGVVRDARGAPRGDVLVRGFCTSPLDAADARTDAEGRFTLPGLRPGAWVVAVDGEPATVRVSLGEGAAVEVELG